MTLAAADRRLLVLYDADCGFCAHSATVLRRLDRGRHLHVVPLQRAGVVAGAPPIERLLETMHVRDTGGRWIAGGAAWIGIAAEVPLLRPLALVARLPGINAVVERAYAWVAGNRHRISRLLGDDVCAARTRTREDVASLPHPTEPLR